jgi:hypothetical protein
MREMHSVKMTAGYGLLNGKKKRNYDIATNFTYRRIYRTIRK